MKTARCSLEEVWFPCQAFIDVCEVEIFRCPEILFESICLVRSDSLFCEITIIAYACVYNSLAVKTDITKPYAVRSSLVLCYLAFSFVVYL